MKGTLWVVICANLAACHTEDPKIVRMDKYEEAKGCYEAIVAYKALAGRGIPTDQYDAALQNVKVFIDSYEADASQSGYKLAVPGEAYNSADLMVSSHLLIADTEPKRNELKTRYLATASKCANEF